MNPDQQFEQILLNTLMQNKEIFNKVFGILKAEYFTHERREIFSLISSFYKEYKSPPVIADVAASIKNLQNQERRTQIATELKAVYQTQISTNVEAVCNETLKFVKDALYLKALEVGSEGLMTKSEKLKLKAEQIMDERAKINIDSDVGIEFHDASAVIDYYGEEMSGLLTQHYSLNSRLGPGFLPGTLSLILAASGVGKSLLMTDLISGFVKAGKKVLLVSLEMAQQEVMKRVHSNVLNIPMTDFLPTRFDRENFIRKIQESRQRGAGIFFAKDYPAQSFSSLQLEGLVETFKNEKNLEFDIIFVDYLGIMKSDVQNPSVGLYSYVKSIAEELRASAKRLNVPIISASQLNRSATNNVDSDNAAVSDSYGSVMTADFMMFLLQTEEMKEQGDIVAKITKNRFSGKTESFPFKVDYSLMRFVDPDIPSTLAADQNIAKIFETNQALVVDQFNNIAATDAALAAKLDAAWAGRNSENGALGAKDNTSNNLEDILNGIM